MGIESGTMAEDLQQPPEPVESEMITDARHRTHL